MNVLLQRWRSIWASACSGSNFGMITTVAPTRWAYSARPPGAEWYIGPATRWTWAGSSRSIARSVSIRSCGFEPRRSAPLGRPVGPPV